ncbi:MAG: aldehyde dehydrogenase [Actinobacteria bacterium]|nr:aldehyde dehydrogenase [Actinomycetota bacterium]
MEGENGVPVIASRWSSTREEDRFVVENPATGEPIAMVQGGGEAEVDAAVRAAHHAWEEGWRWLPARERGRLLMEAARVVGEHRAELAQLECRENGKPLFQAFIDVEMCASLFEYFAGLTGDIPGTFLDLGPVHCASRLEPYGVVGGILPFNWPPIHAAGKAAPALAVGNTVVLKPSDQAPLTVLRIVELLEEVFPQDVIQVVPGPGAAAGAALASHPLVRKLSFTGASETGAAVLRLAADNLTPAMLELGGKNPLLIFDDADIEAAVAAAIEGAFYNKGEACTAASRILVQDTVHDEVVGRLSEAVENLRTGDGSDPATQVGPLVSRRQQRRVLAYIELGKEEGAVVAAQGKLPEDPRLAGGFFVPPTLFTGVRPDMRIAREEIFGPVTCVIPFADEGEALSIANGTEYGLVAAVYTGSQERAARIAQRLQAGMVYVNNYFRGGVGAPFGGVKASGFGREHCAQTLYEYGWIKTVRYPSGVGRIPRWTVDY